MQIDPLIYYFIIFCFLLSKCQLRDRFTRLLHLHEKFAREYVCVRACVRVCTCVCMHAYVCRGCCNINERIKIDTREWVVGSRLWCLKIV